MGEFAQVLQIVCSSQDINNLIPPMYNILLDACPISSSSSTPAPQPSTYQESTVNVCFFPRQSQQVSVIVTSKINIKSPY